MKAFFSLGVAGAFAAAKKSCARKKRAAVLPASDLAKRFVYCVGHGKKRQKSAHIKNFAHHVLQGSQGYLPFAGAQFFPGEQNHAQTRRADVVESRKIQDQALATGVELFGQQAFEFGRTAAVKAVLRAENENVFVSLLLNIHARNLLIDDETIMDAGQLYVSRAQRDSFCQSGGQNFLAAVCCKAKE